MKPKFRHITSLASLLAVVAFSSSANAQLLWDANNTGAAQTDGAGTWTAANQWWNGAANVTWNSVTPDSATIGNGGAGGAISLGGNVTAGTIAFGNHTGTYTIQGTAQTLTVNTGITINTNSNVTFRGTAATTGLLTLTGAGGLTMNGTGLVSMRENITTSYTGTTTINSGVLLLNGGSKPTGNFYLNGGMLTDYFTGTGVFSSGLGTGANQIRIHGASGFGAGNGTSNWRIGSAGSTLVWGASTEGTATGHFNPTTFKLRAPQADNNGPSIFGNPNIDNRLDLNSGSRTINVLLGSGNIGGSRATIASGIQDTGALGSLTLSGGGMLVIGGTTATWGGNTNVNAGILFLGGNSEANIGGGSARNITIASGAGIQFTALNNATLNRIVETTAEIGVMTGTTNNNLDFSSSTGATLPNAFLGNYATNGSKMEYGGTITPGSAGYKLGAVGNSGLLGMLNTAPMTGANSLTIGTGSVQLVGAKTFTGNTTIRNGARLGLAAFTGGTQALSLQNSVLDVGTAANTGTFWLHNTVAGEITGSAATTSVVFGGLTGSRNLASVYSATTGANNSAATAVASVTGFTLNTGTGVNVTYSGVIANFATGTTITKSGDGTQVLSGVNTYTGATSIGASTGTLAIGGAGQLGTGAYAGAVSIGTGSTFQYGSSAAQTLSGLVSGAGSLVKDTSHTSTLTLSGANTGFTGAINVNAGILAITHNDALGTTAGATTVNGNGATPTTSNSTLSLSSATSGLTIAENINLFGNTTGRATLVNAGAFDHTLSGAFDVSSDTNLAQFTSSNNGGSITVTGDITGTLTNSAVLFVRGTSTNANNRLLGSVNLTGGNLAKTDAGTWLVGASGKTYSWVNTLHANGTLRMGAAGVLPSTSILILGENAARTPILDINGFNQTVAGITYNLGTGTRTITNADVVNAAVLTVNNSTDFTTLGSVGNQIVLTGNMGLTKQGAGKLTLTGANTYTGATNVTDGTLLINGSTSSTSIVTVDSVATLGGSGTVGGNTTISGTHSPGNSPGIITHSGNLTYEAGASVLWELVANATTVRGTDFDGINVGGVLDFNGSTTLNLNFQFGSSAVEWSDAFWASSYTGTGGWLVYSGATSLDGFGNLALNLPAAWLDENGDTLASARAGAAFSLFQDTNNIYLNYSAVPEPNVAALIGALGGILLLRRRR